MEREDDALTVAAIAMLAFVVADVGHEVVGHGLGFLIAGGRSGILTTTRVIETQRLGDRGGDIFDLGGPVGNLLFAVGPWLALRVGRPAPGMRLFLWLAMAFSLFWAFGYLIYSGALAKGDWFALIRGLPKLWIWRTVFVALGFAFYRASLRIVAFELPASQARARRLGFLSYVAGGAIACAGAAFDPHGPAEILNSGALASFGAAIGLLQVARFRPAVPGAGDDAVARSRGWLLCAAAVCILYIAVLGPGIRFAV